jgi:hypothetical protein
MSVGSSIAAKDLLLSSTGDLDLTSGGAAFVAGLAAIGQAVRIRLRTFLGEYFLDVTRGLPLLEWGQTKTPASVLRQVELLTRAEILACEGVTQVDQEGVVATFDRAAQEITITVSGVQTDLGLLDAVQETIG